jgi:hypothetical protein
MVNCGKLSEKYYCRHLINKYMIMNNSTFVLNGGKAPASKGMPNLIGLVSNLIGCFLNPGNDYRFVAIPCPNPRFRTSLLCAFLFFILMAGLVSPAMAQSTQVITNGSFENSFTGWDVITDWHTISSSPASCGSTFAMTCDPAGYGLDNINDDLYQTFQVPSGASTGILSVALKMTSSVSYPANNGDFIGFYIWDYSDFYLMGYVDADNNNSWTTYSGSFDFSPWAGQTVDFDIYAYSPSDGVWTKFRVDCVTLTINYINCTPASISAQPQSQSICQGSSASLSVSATGTAPITYQWYNASGSIAGANNSSYTTSSAGSYYCIASNCSGSQAISNTATITVSSVPQTPTVTPSGTQEICAGTTISLCVVSPQPGYNYHWNNGFVGACLTTGTVGNYNVHANGTCGESSPSNTVTVVVQPLPSEPVITANGSTTICQGSGSVFLSVVSPNPQFSYYWSNGATGTSTSVYTAGNYYCSAYGCNQQSAPSNSISVVENQQPNAVFTFSGSGCFYSFSDISSGNPQSWYWSFGDNQSGNNSSVLMNPSHTFTHNGSFPVTLQATNPCGTDSYTQNIYVTGCTNDLTELETHPSFDFKVIPSAFSYSATISFILPQKQFVTIELFDKLGGLVQTIVSGEFKPGKNEILFSRPDGIVPGDYLIRFSSAKNNASIRMLIL